MSARGWASPPLAGPVGAPVRQHARSEQKRLPLARTRLATFLALAGFGSHAWVQMVRPAAPDAMLAALVAAAVGSVLLVAAGRRGWRGPARHRRCGARGGRDAARRAGRRGRAREPCRTALVGRRRGRDRAGAERRAERPRALPRRRRVDADRHRARRRRARRARRAACLRAAPRAARSASRSPPRSSLATLYLVPTMQREGEHPFLGGAAFALLLALFLWLERVERRGRPLAAGVVAAAVLAALVLAPRLDRQRAAAGLRAARAVAQRRRRARAMTGTTATAR